MCRGGIGFAGGAPDSTWAMFPHLPPVEQAFVSARSAPRARRPLGEACPGDGVQPPVGQLDPDRLPCAGAHGELEDDAVGLLAQGEAEPDEVARAEL